MASSGTAVMAKSKKNQKQIVKKMAQLKTPSKESVTPPATSAPLPVPVQTTWYHPGVSTTWQWQLAGTINPNYSVDVYDIDLFDTSKEMIAQLKSSGKKVVCYFSAGSSEDWRSDFTQLDAVSLGKPLDGWKGEKWLDIRTGNVVNFAISRLDLAVVKGCDGVEPDNVDGYENKTGFSITRDDQLIFNRRIATEAHKRGLAIALKNAVDLASDLVHDFDLTINEQCHTYNECDQLAVFTKQGKPILNAEYKFTSKLCAESQKRNIRTLILPKNLNDSSRKSCD